VRRCRKEHKVLRPKNLVPQHIIVLFQGATCCFARLVPGVERLLYRHRTRRVGPLLEFCGARVVYCMVGVALRVCCWRRRPLLVTVILVSGGRGAGDLSVIADAGAC